MTTEIENQSINEVTAEQLPPYAVIETGGKQYRVATGDRILVEKITGTVGEEVTLNRVLLIKTESNCQIGTPAILGASVKAKIISQERGRKTLIFKKRIRKGYTKKQGHRQSLTRLEIADILS